uniref:Uncharacterized protein n=1 Tax=Lepeophtheirus salmonis TaxID=72036 RepID=A0A0K2SWL9_LEPSM
MMANILSSVSNVKFLKFISNFRNIGRETVNWFPSC